MSDQTNEKKAVPLNADPARDANHDSQPRRDPLPMDDARMALVARLDPGMVPVVAALSYPPEGDMPKDYPAHSSAFETLSASHPVLAMAISTYVRSEAHHSESFDKLIEDASRALFGLAPMTDADERGWMHRHDVRPAPIAVNADHPMPPIAQQWADPKKGPTVAEWVSAGYLAKDYPPFGYDSQSTKEEIAAAVKAEKENDDKVDAAKKANVAQASAAKTEPHFMPMGDPAQHPEPFETLSV